jgi:hypothetical protein
LKQVPAVAGFTNHYSLAFRPDCGGSLLVERGGNNVQSALIPRAMTFLAPAGGIGLNGNRAMVSDVESREHIDAVSSEDPAPIMPKRTRYIMVVPERSGGIERAKARKASPETTPMAETDGSHAFPVVVVTAMYPQFFPTELTTSANMLPPTPNCLATFVPRAAKWIIV